MATQPSSGRELPVIVLRDEEAGPDHAKAFVSGYGGRLAESHDGPYLVPRAVVGSASRGGGNRQTRRRSAQPACHGLEEHHAPARGQAARTGIPGLQGRPRRTAAGYRAGGTRGGFVTGPAPRHGSGALDRLGTAHPVLGTVGQALGKSALPTWAAGIWTVALSWPLRVLHPLAKLNRRMRWYARRVTSAGLASRDLRPGRGQATHRGRGTTAAVALEPAAGSTVQRICPGPSGPAGSGPGDAAGSRPLRAAGPRSRGPPGRCRGPVPPSAPRTRRGGYASATADSRGATGGARGPRHQRRSDVRPRTGRRRAAPPGGPAGGHSGASPDHRAAPGRAPSGRM
ncbi:hypothetical protein ACRAWF_10410 [Streptomyces sp. L7]